MADLAEQAKKYAGLLIATGVLIGFFIKPIENDQKKLYEDLQAVRGRVDRLEADKVQVELLKQKLDYELNDIRKNNKNPPK